MLQAQNAFVIHIKTQVFSTSNLPKKKLIFKNLNILIVEIFKFQKMCIDMRDGTNINNTSFEQFDLEKNIKYNLL